MNNPYEIGQVFLNPTTGDKFILTQPTLRQVCLISLNDGNRYVEPVLVGDPKSISWGEFQECTGGGHFILSDDKPKKDSPSTTRYTVSYLSDAAGLREKVVNASRFEIAGNNIVFYDSQETPICLMTNVVGIDNK